MPAKFPSRLRAAPWQAMLLGICLLPLGGCISFYHPSTVATCTLRAEANVYLFYIDGVAVGKSTQHDKEGMVIDAGTHSFYVSMQLQWMQPVRGTFALTLLPARTYFVQVRQNADNKKVYYLTLFDRQESGDKVAEEIAFKVTDPLEKLLHLD